MSLPEFVDGTRLDVRQNAAGKDRAAGQRACLLHARRSSERLRRANVCFRRILNQGNRLLEAARFGVFFGLRTNRVFIRNQSQIGQVSVDLMG